MKKRVELTSWWAFLSWVHFFCHQILRDIIFSPFVKVYYIEVPIEKNLVFTTLSGAMVLNVEEEEAKKVPPTETR